MKVLDPGHHYEVTNYDGGGTQRIAFMKRVGENYPNNTGGPYKGTNCQELLRVLIDRVRYLNEVNIPDYRNEIILANLRSSLFQFESRALDRHGYELDDEDKEKLFIIPLETSPTCPTCGHIICKGNHHGNKVREEENQSSPR